MKQILLVGKLLCLSATLLLQSCWQDSAEPGTIRIRWAHDPETLAPLHLANQVATEGINLLHMGLLQVDLARKAHAPALAETLPEVQMLGDSLMHLHYRLRAEAAWDDGHPVQAADVACTLKLMFCPGLPNETPRARFSFIREIRLDPAHPRQFTLVCKGQSLEFLQESGDFSILPESALDPRGDLRRFSLADLQNHPATDSANPVFRAVARRYAAATRPEAPYHLPGCGPYQLVKWEHDRFLTFRRKPRWWADQVHPAPLVLQAKPQRLNYIIIPDAATATLALQRGDLDVYPQIPAREFARLKASGTSRKKLTFYTSPSYDVVIAGFNTRRPALADALTRRALSRCFDAAGLLRATQVDAGQRTVGIIGPDLHPSYNDSLTLTPFDPTGAMALLQQAGWQRGTAAAPGWFRKNAQGTRQPLRLVMRYRTDETLYATVALQFQAATAALQIPVELRPTESGTLTNALQAGDFDLYVRVLKGNPFMFNFTPILHSLGVGAGNTMGFSTPASDHLIEAIAVADTEAHQASLLRRFQALMQQEAPFVPLFFLPSRIAARRDITGLHISSLKPGYVATAIERTTAPTQPD